jgi:hypothetical protein
VIVLEIEAKSKLGVLERVLERADIVPKNSESAVREGKEHWRIGELRRILGRDVYRPAVNRDANQTLQLPKRGVIAGCTGSEISLMHDVIKE